MATTIFAHGEFGVEIVGRGRVDGIRQIGTGGTGRVEVLGCRRRWRRSDGGGGFDSTAMRIPGGP